MSQEQWGWYTCIHSIEHSEIFSEEQAIYHRHRMTNGPIEEGNPGRSTWGSSSPYGGDFLWRRRVTFTTNLSPFFVDWLRIFSRKIVPTNMYSAPRIAAKGSNFQLISYWRRASEVKQVQITLQAKGHLVEDKQHTHCPENGSFP